MPPGVTTLTALSPLVSVPSVELESSESPAAELLTALRPSVPLLVPLSHQLRQSLRHSHLQALLPTRTYDNEQLGRPHAILDIALIA
jgi:hypothetical protein